MKIATTIACLAAGIALAAPAGLAADDGHTGQQLAQTTPTREISKIAGEVYRFRNNFHYSVFAVTPEGIIATDPIDAEAAAWLKAELASRFNQPVKYLVYSHDHRDHIAGGEVFADTATVIAHENAKHVIIGEQRPTAAPDLTFSDAMTIELGGTVVELAFVGRNHSDNSIVMRFPAERVLFAVDFIPVDSVAFRTLPDAYPVDWIESLKRVETMEFDILAPGHGPLGSHEHVAKFRGYLEDLHGQVLALARQGKTVEEVKQLIDLKKYEGWGGFQDMAMLNVEGMYTYVQLNRRGN